MLLSSLPRPHFQTRAMSAPHSLIWGYSVPQLWAAFSTEKKGHRPALNIRYPTKFTSASLKSVLMQFCREPVWPAILDPVDDISRPSCPTPPRLSFVSRISAIRVQHFLQGSSGPVRLISKFLKLKDVIFLAASWWCVFSEMSLSSKWGRRTPFYVIHTHMHLGSSHRQVNWKHCDSNSRLLMNYFKVL